MRSFDPRASRNPKCFIVWHEGCLTFSSHISSVLQNPFSPNIFSLKNLSNIQCEPPRYYSSSTFQKMVCDRLFPFHIFQHMFLLSVYSVVKFFFSYMPRRISLSAPRQPSFSDSSIYFYLSPCQKTSRVFFDLEFQVSMVQFNTMHLGIKVLDARSYRKFSQGNVLRL